ncbi:MAG TPA: hypothetical protein VGF75_00525, partial [Candidatus Saccharimonadales bacterium]
MAKYHVIIPTDLKPSPAHYEITAATLIADYFKADVEFVLRSNQKTPDFLINEVKWELKSPTGNGKYNVQHRIKTAAKQSSNMIFDARRSKMHMTKLRNEIERHFRYTKPMKRLILIDKNKVVVEIS